MASSLKTVEQIGRIESGLEHVRGTVEGIQNEIKLMNRILAEQHEQLKIHIEGVRLAREQNDMLKRDVDSRLAPIQKHVTQVRLIGTIVGIFLSPAAVYYISQMIRMFKS